MNNKKKNNEIPVGLMWSLTVVLWLFTIIWILDLTMEDSIVFSSIILYSFQLLCIIVFLIDIARTDIFNKAAWIIMIVLLPAVSFPIYLLQRKRLIRIQQRKTHFTGKNEE